MNYSDSDCIIWKSDFRPMPTRPRDVRALLNDVVRHEFSTQTAYLVNLIKAIHSLALLVDDLAIVSTCGKYVARPATKGATLTVDIAKVVTDRSSEYLRAEAWADAIKRHNEMQPLEL